MLKKNLTNLVSSVPLIFTDEITTSNSCELREWFDWFYFRGLL